MSHDMYPHVFTEGRVGSMTTRNRLVMSSMCDNMSGRHGEVTDQKVEYFRRKAQGGVGWINLGYSYVTERGRGCTYYQSGIYEDALIPGLRRLTDAVHEEGARMGCQIAHAGRQTTHHYIEGLEAEAPSPVPEPLLGETPVGSASSASPRSSRSSRRPRYARRRPASTPSSFTEPTGISSTPSCRRSRTSGRTPTAARSRTG